jgi:molecular chaperone HtpG
MPRTSLRFEAIAKPDLYENDSTWRSPFRSSRKARTITVADNGVGMSSEEVIPNIGTIARSGTREFFSR